MGVNEKEEIEESNLEKCVERAKYLVSTGNVQDAEVVLVTALKGSHNDEAQALLDQIQAEKVRINVHEPTETDFEKESQEQLQIEAPNELEKAQYAEVNTNRFKMRAKVLSLEVAVILRDFENDTGNEGPSASVPVSTAIENLLVKVHDAVSIADLGEVEKHLIEAERIYDEEYAKIPNNKKNKADSKPTVTERGREKRKPAPREKAALKGNEGDEIRSILIAQAAINDKDYVKAERFLLRAERLNSTEVAQKLLQVVHNMRNKSSESINEDTSSQNEHSNSATDSETAREDNRRLAVKIIQIAEVSVKEGNYERAKKMIEKAENLHPTDAAKALLQKIIELEAKKEASEQAAQCLTIAQQAEYNDNLDLSEEYLLKAQEICPEIDIGESLLRIRNAKAEKLTAKPAKPEISEVPNTFADPVEMFVSKARSAMAKGLYDVAESIILDLKANTPNVDIDGILSEIRTGRASRSSSGQTITDPQGLDAQTYDRNKYLSHYFFKLAQMAMQTHNFITAKDFLLLACSFDTNDAVIALLKDLREGKLSRETIIRKNEPLRHIQTEQVFTKQDYDTTEQLLRKPEELKLGKDSIDFLKEFLNARTDYNAEYNFLGKNAGYSENYNDVPAASEKKKVHSHSSVKKTKPTQSDELKAVQPEDLSSEKARLTSKGLPHNENKNTHPSTSRGSVGVFQRKSNNNKSVVSTNDVTDAKNRGKIPKMPWKKIGFGCLAFSLCIISYLLSKKVKIQISWA